jgi:GT2 family glycosyltransferase
VQTFPANPLIGNGRGIKNFPNPRRRVRANAASFSEASLARCIAAARQAVAEYLGRTGITGARVEPHPVGLPWLRVIWPLRSEPPVSIIVPIRNHAALLAQLAARILQRTDYANFELLIVDNGSDDANALALLDQLERDGRVRLLHFPGPFNFSAINNFAAAEVTGDVIMLLNNDIDVIRGDWLREMVSQAVRPDVGAVGAKLIYPNDTIQHAGVVLGIIGPGVGPGVAGHSSVGLARADTGYFGHNALTRDVSAVTGACLAMRRQVYLSVGGLDEANLPVAFNDVDLCLRIAATGLRNIDTFLLNRWHDPGAGGG